MSERLIALPRGMSPGFYAFMAPGCIRTDSGDLLMSVEGRSERDRLNDDIRRCEQSLRRFEEMEEDEVDSDEYQDTLTRLVALREQRDSL